MPKQDRHGKFILPDLEIGRSPAYVHSSLNEFTYIWYPETGAPFEGKRLPGFDAYAAELSVVFSSKTVKVRSDPFVIVSSSIDLRARGPALTA